MFIDDYEENETDERGRPMRPPKYMIDKTRKLFKIGRICIVKWSEEDGWKIRCKFKKGYIGPLDKDLRP